MLFDVKYRRFKSNPNGEFIDLSSLREKPFAVKFVKICQLLINTLKGYVRKGMQN